MIEIYEKLNHVPGFKQVLEKLSDSSESVSVSGLIGSSRTLLAAWLFKKTGRSVFFLSPDQESSERAFDDFRAFLGKEEVSFFPSWEIQSYEIRAPHAENIGDRLSSLFELSSNKSRIICSSGIALMEPTASREYLEDLALNLSVGSRIDPAFLAGRLAKMGFTRRPVVEQLGDFAVRGGLIDTFPATSPEPIRVEFFGDQVESIRSFSVLSQRSLSRKDRVVILPLREMAVDMQVVETVCEDFSQTEAIALHQALGSNGTFDGLQFFRHLFSKDKCCLVDYLPSDTIVIFDDPESIKDEMGRVLEGAARRYNDRGDYPFGDPGKVYFDHGKLTYLLSRFVNIRLRGLFRTADTEIQIPTKPPEPFGSHIRMLVDKLREYRQQGYSARIYCDGEGQKRRLNELLSEYDIALPLTGRRISSGFVIPQAKLWFLADHEIFTRLRARKKARRFKEGIALSSYQSLQPGDYVVHIDFGIGRYRGLQVITVDGRKRDCLLIIYAGGDKVFVPIEEFSRVQKFAGKEGTPALSRLGTGTWEKTKARTRKAIMEMARELIELYAKRQALPGFAFGLDSAWQKELEASFPYEETPDQQKAIDDIKADMERSVPMDRLICGDVGYGKTEVGIRAAFKAVESGKQVAVLVPTTILAQQHLQTFRSRLEQFPLKVELLSRFRSPKESKQVKEGLKKGIIDIVIGTHKLLQKDIQFKDLGLLIVDEEQRFGVTHKERIKKLKTQVDTLTLTATPIPRTLQLSLLGARDMSIINTPPKDRLPIVTEVALFSERIITEAIERELIRGGQVFFVHNRVESIDAIFRYLKKLLPMVDIAIGHGQMPERHLERVMIDFLAKKHQILLATTIIESGLDMPMVNTIIVNRSDRLGLAQLYQLRGRVGRSSRRAYAYLLVPPLKLMTDKARKRVRAIEEFTELGSGLHLAMRDLEIRGAGNILGPQQHGFIEEVGFDLYCRLLEEAVAELKEIKPGRERLDLKVQTDLDLFIPQSYVDDPNLRVELYRAVSEITDSQKLAFFSEELKDRFGPYPEEVENLLSLAACRILALKLGAKRIIHKRGELYIEFPRGREFERTELEGWRKRIIGKMEFYLSDGLKMRMKLEDSSSTSLKNALRLLVG
jgi:transcription-repair coupling factor (superfamily II helicase)